MCSLGAAVVNMLVYFVYQDTQGHNRVIVSTSFIDLWTEVRDWSLRSVCRLRLAAEQTWRISHEKLISRLPLRLNVERSLVYILYTIFGPNAIEPS